MKWASSPWAVRPSNDLKEYDQAVCGALPNECGDRMVNTPRRCPGMHGRAANGMFASSLGKGCVIGLGAGLALGYDTIHYGLHSFLIVLKWHSNIINPGIFYEKSFKPSCSFLCGKYRQR